MPKKSKSRTRKSTRTRGLGDVLRNGRRVGDAEIARRLYEGTIRYAAGDIVVAIAVGVTPNLLRDILVYAASAHGPGRLLTCLAEMCVPRYVAVFPYVHLHNVGRCFIGAYAHKAKAMPPVQRALLRPESHGVALLVLLGLVSEPVGRQMLLDLVAVAAPAKLRRGLASMFDYAFMDTEAGVRAYVGYGVPAQPRAGVYVRAVA